MKATQKLSKLKTSAPKQRPTSSDPKVSVKFRRKLKLKIHLKTLIYILKKMSKFTKFKEKNIYTSLINMLEQKTLLPVVIFTFSRKRCDENIYMLTNLDLNTAAEKSRIHVLVKDWLASLNPDDQNIPQIVHLTESLKRGIAVHHSGILPIMKEIIELLFQMGLIRVLFATETFAMGINMPARTVGS